jgi:transcriptional regulator with XRE-family HTH domain
VTALGEVLETARRAQGLTQAELAERAGITQAALSRYENDLREPETDTLQRLADALGVTVQFLKHAGRARGGMAMDAHMRRRATAPPATWRQLEARLNVYRWHASHLYIARRTTEGKTIREIKRALKREASPASSSDSYKPPSNNRQRRTKPDKAPSERQWTPAPTSPERSPADSPKVALDGT